MKTTQDAFHVIRGHVTDGCQVIMRNGDTWTIKQVSHNYTTGWKITNGKGDMVAPIASSAYIVQDIIVNS